MPGVAVWRRTISTSGGGVRILIRSGLGARSRSQRRDRTVEGRPDRGLSMSMRYISEIEFYAAFPSPRAQIRPPIDPQSAFPIRVLGFTSCSGCNVKTAETDNSPAGGGCTTGRPCSRTTQVGRGSCDSTQPRPVPSAVGRISPDRRGVDRPAAAGEP